MTQWSLEHRQTSLSLPSQPELGKHALNEAFNIEQKKSVVPEVKLKRDIIECAIQCPEEAVWEIRVNKTACGGVKHIRTGNMLELHATIHLHAQDEDRHKN